MAAAGGGTGGGAKAQLRCHACERLLEYDAGAQYVQCFSCNTMNAVLPAAAPAATAAAAGGRGGVSAAGPQTGGKVLSMLCAVCHTTNLAPYGINYVRCGHCNTISQVSHAYKNVVPAGAPGPKPASTAATAERREPAAGAASNALRDTGGGSGIPPPIPELARPNSSIARD